MPKPKWTTSEQHAWLTERLTSFAEAQENKTVPQFYTSTYADWFDEFRNPAPSQKQLEQAGNNTEKASALVTKMMKERVYYWFFNHSRATTSGSNKKELLRLTGKPRKLQREQAYSRLYYDKKIKDIVEERYKEHTDSVPKEQQVSRIAFAAIVTKQLWDDETEEVKKEVEEYRGRQKTSEAVNIDGEEDNEDGIDDKEQQAKNMKMQLAIDRLPKTMKTVVQAIESQTGWPCMIVAGGPMPKLGGKVNLISITQGVTRDTGEEFEDAADDWEGIIDQYDSFLHRVFPPDVCARVALRSSSSIPSSHSGSPIPPTGSRMGTPASNDVVGTSKPRHVNPKTAARPSSSKPTKSKINTASLVPPQASSSKMNQRQPNPPKISAYELERDANIARNKEFLAEIDQQLGTPPPMPPAPKGKAKMSSKKVTPVEPSKPRRGRSAASKEAASKEAPIGNGIGQNIHAEAMPPPVDDTGVSPPTPVRGDSNQTIDDRDVTPEDAANISHAGVNNDNAGEPTFATHPPVDNTGASPPTPVQGDSNQTINDRDVAPEEAADISHAGVSNDNAGELAFATHPPVDNTGVSPPTPIRGDSNQTINDRGIAPEETADISHAEVNNDNAGEPAFTTHPSHRDVAMAEPSEPKLPHWMPHAEKYLLGIEEAGEGWKELIDCWMKLERLLNYPDREDRGHWLSAKGRPEEVKFWNARGKKFPVVPQFKPGEFGVVWRSWWESLQPDWRSHESWPLSQDVPAGEDWSILRRGGMNGLFVVLMCLSWWAPKATTAKDKLAFDAAKKDVIWVFQQIFESVSSVPQLKRAADEVVVTDRGKRRRTQ